MKRKLEVELEHPCTLGNVIASLERLRMSGAPADASIRITGGYPGAEEIYTAEAVWEEQEDKR